MNTTSFERSAANTVFDWCTSCVGTTLHNDEWDRRGLLEFLLRTLREAIADDKWGIKHIALICSISSYFDGAGYWASAKRRGGPATIHPIWLHTLRLSAVPNIAAKGVKDCGSTTFKAVPRDQIRAPLSVHLKTQKPLKTLKYS